jgi:ElaB/YqjD/DUF883 family membrane-anchored ribosome-binding protein
MGEKPDTIKKPRTRAASTSRRGTSDVPADDVVVAGGEERDEEIVVSAFDGDDDIAIGAPAGDHTGTDTEAIRDEIEHTRAQMSGTIDEIQARLSPRRLMDEAKETVRDATVGKVKDVMNTAGDSASGIVDRIKANPIPAAMIGIGAWWLFGKSQPRTSSGGWSRPSYGGRSAYASGGYNRWDDSDGASNLTERTQERVSEFADRAEERASEFAGRAKERASEYADRVGEYADQAQTEFDRMLRDNPLAIGAAAIAVGAALGFAVPETRHERQWMGDMREQLADKAQDLAQGAVDKVQQVASNLSLEDSK